MSMISRLQSDVTFIHADELTSGDIIKHFKGDIWQVYSEPEYTIRGIEFEILDLGTNDRQTQKVSFHPQWRFELVVLVDNSMEVAA